MSRSGTLVLLGLLVLLMPFSGLPMSLRSLLTVILGACVLGVGISMRQRAISAVSRESLSAEPTSDESVVLEPPTTVSPI